MTTRHTPVQTLVDFCLANHPDIQEVSGLTEDEIRQAARLIAAAPEMLEALQYVINDLGGFERVQPDTIAVVVSAITRATGRERGA